MQWLNEPSGWQRDGDMLRLSADPGTDFWRQTGYGYVHDNGHVYGEVIAGDLDVSVRVRADFTSDYDQAGIMLLVDGRTWLKSGLELFEGRPRLSTVLTLGQSSWTVANLPEGADEVRLRASRRGDAVEVRYTVGDGTSELAALVHLPPGGEVLAGVMCAAPEGPGFSVTFRDLRIAARSWAQHSHGSPTAGQEPDLGDWQDSDGPEGSAPGWADSDRPEGSAPGWADSDRPEGSVPGWADSDRPEGSVPSWADSDRPEGWAGGRTAGEVPPVPPLDETAAMPAAPAPGPEDATADDVAGSGWGTIPSPAAAEWVREADVDPGPPGPTAPRHSSLPGPDFANAPDWSDRPLPGWDEPPADDPAADWERLSAALPGRSWTPSRPARHRDSGGSGGRRERADGGNGDHPPRSGPTHRLSPARAGDTRARDGMAGTGTPGAGASGPEPSQDTEPGRGRATGGVPPGGQEDTAVVPLTPLPADPADEWISMLTADFDE